MTRFLASLHCLLLALAADPLAAQSSLDQSPQLNQERTAIASEFNQVQVRLRSAKTEAERQSTYPQIESIAKQTNALRAKIVTANEAVITELNRRRDGVRDRSATIKAVTERLTKSNQFLSTLPLPVGPGFSPLEVNQIQRVLDTCKTSLDQHRHACQNLQR